MYINRLKKVNKLDGELFGSSFIDVPFKERKFNEYYEYFFGHPSFKRDKQLVYQCSHNCGLEHKLEDARLQRC
jgi:hypothetical protein